MERIQGGGLGERYWGAAEEERRNARELLLSLMARLHALPRVSVVEATPVDLRTGELTGLEDLFTQLDEEARSACSPAMRWLRSRTAQVTVRPPVAIHGDFHYNNVLLRTSGEPVVIDWSNCRPGDPRLDLTWLSLVAGGDDNFGPYADTVAWPLTDMDVFEAIGAARMILVALAAMTHGPAARGLRPGIEPRLRDAADHTFWTAGRLGAITGLSPNPIIEQLHRRLGSAD